jgi:hypothetical protein
MFSIQLQICLHSSQVEFAAHILAGITIEMDLIAGVCCIDGLFIPREIWFILRQTLCENVCIGMCFPREQKDWIPCGTRAWT